MDITLKLKRAVATFAAAALFASTASVAIAQTFMDVPTDAWYFDYVEQLVDDGVIDAADYYRPADALNRAELTKIAITAIEGLAGYEAPATPTFDDVAADAWYYDYVEAAVQLGIVNGYTDAGGNLTGMFGPGDTVNRAAATKILVNAFSVPTDLDPASTFPDVMSGAWYYDYVVTAYNQSVLDGYDNGYFGPADPVTRAQVAKLVVLAQNPVERVVGEGEGEGEGEGVSEGDLEVSLNDDTPASSTLPRAAASVDLLAFDLTAADDDVNVSQIVVTRGGVGQTGDWDALYLYEGAKRLTTGRSINSDTNTSTFPVSLTIEAGTTTTIRLVGDVAATPGASNQHYFYIASAADVTSNAQSVSGDFPTVGNTFTMGGAGTTVNSITVSAGSAPSQPQIGALDAEIASVKFQAGSTNDVALHQATFSQGGSLSSSKLLNCRFLRGTDEVATADGFDGDRVTFVLDTPYVIPEGQSKTFYVRCDIDGGRTTDNIRVYLDENTDVVAIDQQYGFGATVTNTFNTSAQTNTITLKGGDVTVTDNGPAATQLAQNSTNNELLNFAITTARDLTVRDTFIQIDVKDASGNGPNVTGAGVTSVIGAGGGTAATGTITFNTQAEDEDNITVDGVTYVFDAAGDGCVIGGTCINTSASADVTGDATLLVGAETGANTSMSNVAGVVTVTADVAGTAGNAIAMTEPDANEGGASNDIAFSGATLAGGVDGAGTDTSSFCVTPGGTAALAQGDMLQIPAASGTVYGIITNVPAPSAGCTVGGDWAITTNLPAGDAVTPTTTSITEVNPYDYIKNVRLVDLDTETTLAGPMTDANDGATLVAGPPSAYNKVHSEDYELTGGETRHLSVQADLDQSMPQGYSIRAQVRYSDGVSTSSYVKDLGANEFVLTADIVGAGPTALAGKWMTTATNSLTVGLASTPTSQTYVKGDTGVSSLGVALTAGDAGDITVKRITLRVYGDTGGTTLFSATGDTAANTLVSSVTLYDGSDVLAGPKGLSGVLTAGASTTAFDADSGDYYKVQFDDLNVTIDAGATKTLVAKLNLLNTATATRFIAVDVDPDNDILAEDADANTITPSPTTSLNGTAAAHTPELTVVVSGTLSAYSEANPDASNLVAGKTAQPVAKYRFHSLREGFDVNKLTIVNDAAGDFGDAAVATAAVSKVTIKYPDANGVQQTKSSAMTAGTATFSGLDFIVPAGEDAFLEVYADTSTMAGVGESLSGQTLRLGLQNTGNTVSTFEAIGTSSSTADYFTGAPSASVSNSAAVNQFVVRKTMPTFAKVSGSTTLINGENTLYGVTVTADSAGSVGFARLVYDYSLSGVTISGSKIYRGSTLITTATVTDVGGANLIVVFDQEETVSAGASQTYYLKSTVAGASTGDSLTASLGNGDEAAALTGLTLNTNPNTGKIFVNGNAASGIFTVGGDFAGTWITDRNIIWSDKSADAHGYATIAGGTVTTDTGSYDWTNGYLLKITELTSNTLTY